MFILTSCHIRKVLGPVKTQTFENTIHLHLIQTLVPNKDEFCTINFVNSERKM